MPHKTYALEKGGEKNLEISWKFFSVNIEIHYKGTLLGVIRKQSELRKGRVFQLPDGTELQVKRGRNGLNLRRNGRGVPGTPADPEVKLAGSASEIFLYAAMNIILCLLAVVLRVKLLQVLGFGILSAIIGIILIVLGIFTKRRSLAALILALIIQGMMHVLIAINAVILFLLYFSSSPGLLSLGVSLQSMAPWIGVFVFYGLNYFLIFPGIRAIREIKGEIPASM